MIDPHMIDNETERVKQHLKLRGEGADGIEAVDRIVALAERRRELIVERDNLRATRNAVSKEIGALYKSGNGEEAEALKAKVQAASERSSALEDALREVEEERRALSLGLPNLLHPSVPEGQGEDDNRVDRSWGTPGAQEGPSHVEIGTRLGILDLERGAKLTGARFWSLRGAGARLERALINFFVDLHVDEHGYTEVMVPYMVHRSAAEGVGQLPKFEADMFKIEGPVNGEDAFLIPTAEVPVTSMHRDEILAEDQLPMRYACFTPCFRSEAGSAGRDVRGLIRVHQFHKVELVWLTTPDRAEDDHAALVAHAETALQRLELPYRVVELCSADVGFSAARCFDLEVWLPSQGYREISSCSHFTDFQARRSQIRYRPGPQGAKNKPRLVHTLNGSGLAVGRTLVAILENNVQPDGSVRIPPALQPYMGGMEVIAAG